MNEKIKTKRLYVTIPEDLWNEMSKAVSGDEMNEFIAEATRQHLLRVNQRRGIEKGFGAWSGENHPELAAPQDTSEYVRSIRDADKLRLSQLDGYLAS